MTWSPDKNGDKIQFDNDKPEINFNYALFGYDTYFILLRKLNFEQYCEHHTSQTLKWQNEIEMYYVFVCQRFGWHQLHGQNYLQL